MSSNIRRPFGVPSAALMTKCRIRQTVENGIDAVFVGTISFDEDVRPHGDVCLVCLVFRS